MFTSLPTQFGSLYEQQKYELYNYKSGDSTIKIRNEEDEVLIGVKKFYNTKNVSMNIAPIIRSFALPTLSAKEEEGFLSKPQGIISVDLEYVETGEYSGERTFTLSKSAETKPGLRSIFGSQRLISVGENDFINIVVDPTQTLQLQIDAFSKRVYADSEHRELLDSKSYAFDANQGNFACFNFLADGYDERTDLLVVYLRQGGELLEEIYYYIVPKPQSRARLAWISSRGVIEQYSFVHKKREAFNRSAQKEYTLVSAFELYDMRLILAEIASSPKIWIDCGEEFREIKLLQEAIETSPAEALAVVELKISYDA